MGGVGSSTLVAATFHFLHQSLFGWQFSISQICYSSPVRTFDAYWMILVFYLALHSEWLVLHARFCFALFPVLPCREQDVSDMVMTLYMRQMFRKYGVHVGTNRCG